MPDLRKMNKAQRDAVTWGEGPLLLLAGPGSGKTFTIVNRILFLLEQGVPPEKILVVTFTKEAAISMQCRFRRMSNQFYPVNFGTFHSVFYHILQESGGFRQKSLIHNSQKKKFLSYILKQLFKKNGASIQQTEDDFSKILSAISYYKNTGDFENAEKKAPMLAQGRFREIFEEYCNVLEKESMLDFDDMLFACRELLTENRKAAEYWKSRFTHILIDEFQDINPVQYDILKELTCNPYNVFAVGDDDQSIYGFRGSKPELMRRFEEEFHAKRMLLDINYRCGRKIIDASLAVIGENRDRFVKELREAPGKREKADSGEKTGGGKVSFISFQDKEAENDYLKEKLNTWLKEHQEDGEICAVLFRTNTCMQRMAAKLKKAGIPYLMKERAQSIYEHFIVRDIMAYLLLAAGEWKREYLLRVINKPSRYISREAVGEGRSIREIKEYYKNSSCREEIFDSVIRNLEQLERHLICMKGLSPGLSVHYILKAVGYESYLKSLTAGNREKAEEWYELLEWLKADAAGYRSVKEWTNMQELFTDSREKTGSFYRKEKEEKIRLMTVHAAKGLEFHTVFLPDCNERIYPHGNMPDSTCVEEERRLFYVAMTRAKENLELLYLTGDSGRSRLPSRFLNPLIYSSSSINSSNSQLSKYSSKASATFSYSSSSEI